MLLLLSRSDYNHLHGLDSWVEVNLQRILENILLLDHFPAYLPARLAQAFNKHFMSVCTEMLGRQASCLQGVHGLEGEKEKKASNRRGIRGREPGGTPVVNVCVSECVCVCVCVCV